MKQILPLLVIVVFSAGCASVPLPEAIAPDASPARLARKQAAIAAFEQKRNEAQYQAALDRTQQGAVKDAEGMLRQLLGRNPDHVEGRRLLAEVLAAQDRPREAAAELEQVLAGSPDHAQAHHMLGLIYESSGQLDQARQHFLRAAELEPENDLYALCAFGEDAEWGESAEMPDSWEYRGAAQQAAPSSAARNVPLISASQRQAIIDLAESETGRQRLGFALDAIDAGRIDDALAAASQTTIDEPANRQIPAGLALHLLRLAQPDAAVRVLADALARRPDSAHLWRILGSAHYERGDYSSAEQAIARSLSLDNSNALSYFLMGRIQTELGRNEAAAANLQQACRLDPQYSVAR